VAKHPGSSFWRLGSQSSIHDTGALFIWRLDYRVSGNQRVVRQAQRVRSLQHANGFFGFPIFSCEMQKRHFAACRCSNRSAFDGIKSVEPADAIADVHAATRIPPDQLSFPFEMVDALPAASVANIRDILNGLEKRSCFYRFANYVR
jgi:hypothetical protein